MNNDKLETIKEILRENYNGKMPEKTIDAYAEDLYDSLLVSQYSLDDIIAIINEYEESANIEDSEWYYIFGRMIDLLENSEVTARRLYNSFMDEMDLLDTFIKLVEDNAEYISEEELAAAKRKAFEVFDSDVLAAYGIHNEE